MSKVVMDSVSVSANDTERSEHAKPPGLEGPGGPALAEVMRSFGAFFFGMGLVSVYGAMALFVQKQDPWFCAFSTVSLALLTAFGMGLSVNIRTNILLMLPTLCSAKGKKLLLFFIATLLMQGPVANTMDNFERAAVSLVCGKELVANQTLELMKRATMPLRNMLDAIREITRNAHAVAARVENLVKALTDNVLHIASTLRNVLHFLVVIGEVCNEKMGSPYRKCNLAFEDAIDDCEHLLGAFDFLCDIVEVARPVCGMARAGELFCVLPSYIADQFKKQLAQPTVKVFQRIKKEFEFNISANVTIDVDIDSSQSLKRMSQRILREVSEELGKLRILGGGGWMAIIGLLLLAYAYYKAVKYKHKYLHQGDFDNIYVTVEFTELDERMSQAGRPTVLPLTNDEARTYIAPMSPYLTPSEWLVVIRGVVSLLRHLVLGGLILGLDVMVFWILALVRRQIQGDLIVRAPVRLPVKVNGTGYASDIVRDIVSSFNILQKGNVSVLSKECLIDPSEPDYTGYIMIGFLYGLVLLVCLAGCLAQRCRRLICAGYYPARERERILFLHSHILSERIPLGRALWLAVSSTVRSSRADEGGGGGDGWRSKLLTLLLRVRGGSYVASLLGVSPVRCLACREAKEGADQDGMVFCPTGRCGGLYCQTCYQSLGNSCAVCGGPLSYEDDSEDELDSSDDEKADDYSEPEMSNKNHSDMDD